LDRPDAVRNPPNTLAALHERRHWGEWDEPGCQAGRYWNPE
jgi:hypothetical protein